MLKSAQTCLITILVICTSATTLHASGCGTPSAALRINGWSTPMSSYVTVCPYTPIIASAQGSNCAEKYFLSIELSDRWWNRKGGEYAEWLSKSTQGTYGNITSGFKLNEWAEAHYFHFVPGQYYRVKLAIGPWWRETTQLIYVDSTPKSVVSINNQTAQIVDVTSPYVIVLDGSAATCATNYFVSIELSDQSSSRKGGEYGQWLEENDFVRYGRITSFNVKKWAEDHYFHFYSGQYYRVKLALGPTWVETVKLIHIL